jgi:hypothetical protein
MTILVKLVFVSINFSCRSAIFFIYLKKPDDIGPNSEYLNSMKKLEWLIKIFTFLSCPFFLIVSSTQAWARPEFAAETNIVNCAVCHVNPYGSGARTLRGKQFGSRDYKAAWLSKSDLFTVDARMQDYSAQRNPPSNSQTKGLMLMNVIPTANLPIAAEPTDHPVAELVLSYNYAPVGAGAREGYFLFRTAPTEEHTFVSSVLVGNFSAPFGLLTEEHRTYTRQMVAKTNRSFESGVMINGDPSFKFHYDAALTSGFANGGTGSDTHPDSWGAILNIRHQISDLPLQVGVSHSQEGTSALDHNLSATSLYMVFASDRYAGEWTKGNLQIEATYASGWDNSNYTTTASDGISYFIPSSAGAWQTSLMNANSFGWTGLLNWDLNRHWILQFKHEQFIPDASFQGDSFYRNGVGFKYYFGSNMNLIVRVDKGEVTRPGLTSTDLASIKAIGDTYFALLHLWL